MKFQRKLLALAVMGFALAAPAAHAAIDNGVNSPGNGELFLNVWSDQGTAANLADDIAYTLDTGLHINDFTIGATTQTFVAGKDSLSFSKTFLPDAHVGTFLSSVLTGSTVRFNVVGTDSFAADRFLTTAAVGTTEGNIASTSATSLHTLGSQIGGSAIGAINILANTQNVGATGFVSENLSNASAFSNGTGYAGDGGFLGQNLGGNVLFNSSGVIGQKLPFFLLYETSGSNTAPALVHQFGTNAIASWTLGANGALTYDVTPVPEADTWAMFAAGLLVVGAIARRRLSV